MHKPCVHQRLVYFRNTGLYVHTEKLNFNFRLELCLKLQGNIFPLIKQKRIELCRTMICASILNYELKCVTLNKSGVLSALLGSLLHALAIMRMSGNLPMNGCYLSLLTNGISISSRSYANRLRVILPIKTPHPTCANQDAWAFVTRRLCA